MSQRPEIVSPAGNIEKLELAVKFGADAVYFGGEEFNLRAKAGNFSREDIEKALEICAEAGVKSIFLLNSFLHESDIPAAREYISSMKKYPFSAVMVSDPGMIGLIQESGAGWDIHLSTQMSTLNSMSVRFWQERGIKRIVLARETTLEEIASIKENTGADIEVFVHGALCVAYSGRCLLSRYLSGKDANQGDCTQPCRWKYSLVEEKRPDCRLDIIEHGRGTEIISSKDLKLIRLIPEYIKAGVNAFKIEGRMKSVYYAANVTRIYKAAVDAAIDGTFAEKLPFFESELDLVSHRPYTEDLFNEFGSLGFSGVPYVLRALFMGYRKKEFNANQYDVAVFNPLFEGDSFDAVYPLQDGSKDELVYVEKIFAPDGEEINMARPGADYRIQFSRPVGADAVFRKVLEEGAKR